MKKVISLVLVVLSFMLCLTSCMTKAEVNDAYVSVSASATISVEADTASFSITAENTASTTEEARNNSSLMIEKAISILKDEFGISDDEIRTEYMNIDPYYEWVDGSRVIKGQRATQKLTINLKNGLDRVGKVYDRLSVLDGISISSISYSKSDTSEALMTAREEASRNALKKAEDYARGVNKEVGDVVSITEGSVSYSYPTYANSKLMVAEASSSDYASTTYYSGDLTVSATVSISFTLK